MKAAARIGYTFGVDPVAVLSEPVTLRSQVREAALMVAFRDEKSRWEAFGGES